MTSTFVLTAGECLRVDCAPGWVATQIERGLLGEARTAEQEPATPVTVHLIVESGGRFALPGAQLVTRGAWSDGTCVVLEDACTSGFNLRCEPQGDVLVVHARWAPPARTLAAAAVLRGRAALLLRAALLQYPVMWWSGVRGRAPLHASAVRLSHTAPLLAGPSGVGKSTLVEQALAAGHVAACDNLAMSDGRELFGVVEPRRITSGQGRRTSHGRREAAFADRLPSLQPDRVIAVSLSETAPEGRLAPLEPDDACRTLVTGTYLAGELRRYWPFAAALALGTGLGPPAPPVEAVAARLTGALPCQSLTLSRRSPTRLPDPTEVEPGTPTLVSP